MSGIYRLFSSFRGEPSKNPFFKFYLDTTYVEDITIGFMSIRSTAKNSKVGGFSGFIESTKRRHNRMPYDSVYDI